MAEENQNKIHETTETPRVETHDRGLFDFGRSKPEEKTQEEVIVSEFDKVKVSEPSVTKVEESKHDDGEKKHSLLDKLQRSDSSSSSSSDEEEGEGGEKKKKKGKKGLKEKIKEKVSGEKEEVKYEEDTTVPVEKCDAEPATHHDAVAATNPEEKKGFLQKIKEKLPGQHKKPEEGHASSEYAATEAVAHESEAEEKKGIFEKIKEKLPGYHPKTEEEKEEEKKNDATH